MLLDAGFIVSQERVGLGFAMRALSHGEVDNPLGGQGSARLRGAGDTAAERAGKHVDELAIFCAVEGARLPRCTCDPTSHDAGLGYSTGV